MKRSLADLLLELRASYGARVYTLGNGSLIIHVGDDSLRDALVKVLQQRCHIQTAERGGEKIIILKED